MKIRLDTRPAGAFKFVAETQRNKKRIRAHYTERANTMSRESMANGIYHSTLKLSQRLGSPHRYADIREPFE